jgi:hypothetical protein
VISERGVRAFLGVKRPYTRVKPYDRLSSGHQQRLPVPAVRIRELPVDEVPSRCACLGPGRLYIEQASGIAVRACSVLHAVAAIEKKLAAEAE